MKVRALQPGYAGKDGHQYRNPGDVFEVEDGAEAPWYEAVDKKKSSKGIVSDLPGDTASNSGTSTDEHLA